MYKLKQLKLFQYVPPNPRIVISALYTLHSLLQSTNSIARQCIMNASSNANTLIGYKMSYYRSMYGIDICNADLNDCFF